MEMGKTHFREQTPKTFKKEIHTPEWKISQGRRSKEEGKKQKRQDTVRGTNDKEKVTKENQKMH